MADDVVAASTSNGSAGAGCGVADLAGGGVEDA